MTSGPRGLKARIFSDGLSPGRRVQRQAQNDGPTPLIGRHQEGETDGDEVEVERVFAFDDLQGIRRLSDDVATASMVIDQNKRILSGLRNRYSTLAENPDFGRSVDLPSCRPAIVEFLQQVEALEGDLDAQQCHVKALAGGLEKTEEMFKGILQYVNMRTAEQFAKTSQDSARTMERWTERMHDIAAKTEQETISMHVITIFTLIFLPGTFVSTVFSSGMISFDDNAGTNKLGDWGVRWPAVWLFLAICLPLMALTLSSWWIKYRLAKKQVKTAEIPEAPSHKL